MSNEEIMKKVKALYNSGRIKPREYFYMTEKQQAKWRKQHPSLEAEEETRKV